MKEIPGKKDVTAQTFSYKGRICEVVVTGKTDRAKAINILAENVMAKSIARELEQDLVNAIDVLWLTTPTYGEPGSEIGFDNTIAELLQKYAEECPSSVVKAAARTALAKRRS